MGVVYVLTNPAFDKYVKVGRTSDLEDLKRQLDNSSVPYAFRCEYAVEVENDATVERNVYDAFSGARVSNKKEFFLIDAQKVISALKLTNGREVTPRIGERGGEKKSYTFADAHVYEGDVLFYSKDKSITARVISRNKVKFEGKIVSASEAANILERRKGHRYKVNGRAYWMKDGESIYDRYKRYNASEGDD